LPLRQWILAVSVQQKGQCSGRLTTECSLFSPFLNGQHGSVPFMSASRCEVIQLRSGRTISKPDGRGCILFRNSKFIRVGNMSLRQKINMLLIVCAYLHMPSEKISPLCV
jgi:hypothetical protein